MELYCLFLKVINHLFIHLINKFELKYLQSIYSILVHSPLLAGNVDLSEDHIFNNESFSQDILGF